MPTLESHPSSTRVKALFIGDSGEGKTGACACLANAGYELFIVDLDDGLDVLRAFVKPKFLKNVHYVTIKERFRGTKNGVEPRGAPTVYGRTMTLLNNWVDPETKESFGPIETWGPERVLIVDSFTALGEAAYRFVRGINVRAVDEIDFRDYGQAQIMQEGLIELVMSDAVKCNVLIIAHINYQEAYGEALVISSVMNKDGSITETKEEKGYPSAIGKKLAPKVGRHFNTTVMAKSEPFGQQVKRKIRTTSTPVIALKNPVPHILKPELPLESGLLTIFEAIKTHGVTEEKETA